MSLRNPKIDVMLPHARIEYTKCINMKIRTNRVYLCILKSNKIKNNAREMKS